MSLYQRQDHRIGISDLRTDLAQLRLPEPALVIDVRQGSNHPPLLWNLADDLDNLGAEMQQDGVYRWRRYLTDCVDLLTLTFPQGLVSDSKATFKINTRSGYEKELHGTTELIEELGRIHVNRVRNNRIAAVRDREKGTINASQSPADPEQAAVQVFFLFDAEDQESMVCTGLFAAWLKDWYHEYSNRTFQSRGPRLKTYALCLSVDAYRHRTEELADYLEWAPQYSPALDAVILAHTYGDDEAYISPKLQSFQVELLLYILLLWPENAQNKPVMGLTDNQNIPDDVDKEQRRTPWPVYIAGISSLERSTRHARHYVNKSQIATTLQILLDREEVDAQKKSGQINRQVRKHLEDWKQAVKILLSSTLDTFAPEAQDVKNVLQEITTSLPWKSKKALWQQSFHEHDAKISSLYTSTAVSFEHALHAPLCFPILTNKALKQRLMDNSGDALEQSYLTLAYQTTQMLAALFGGALGMVPRAQQHLTELEAFVDFLRTIAEDQPDLQVWQQEIEAQANPLRQKVQGKWPLFRRKKLRQGCEQTFLTLCSTTQTHLDKVQDILAARLALQLLEVAGLSTYQSTSPDRRAVTRLEHELIQAHKDALAQQKQAYERAAIGLDDVEEETTQELRWLNLKSRRNVLDWERIKAFAFPEGAAASLNALGEYLLRLIGLQDPLPFIRLHLHTPGTSSTFNKHTITSSLPLYSLTTIFVGTLLLLEAVDFDINTLQTLLTRYDDLPKNGTDEEQALLEQAVLELQQTIKAAIEEKNRPGYQPGVSAIKRVQPLVNILEAWMDQQLGRDALFAELFGLDDILIYLKSNKIAPKQVLADLRERNRVLGYRNAENGKDRYYLLLPPGEAGDDFLHELDMQDSEEIHPVRFPDYSMLVFCHMYVSYPIISSPNTGRWGYALENDVHTNGNSHTQKGVDPQDIINEAALMAAASAVAGTVLPAIDLLAIAAIWTKMTVDLAQNAEHEVNAELAKKALASLGTGAALYYAGSRLFTAIFHAIPGIGTLTMTVINAVLNWIYTQRLGTLLASEFAQPDFDPQMLLTPGLTALGTILSLPHYSEVRDALTAIGDPAHLAAHAPAGAANQTATSTGA